MNNPIEISRIAIGTAQFGMDYGISNKSGKTPIAEVRHVLEMAELQGINTLDTAYGYGSSEEVLGEIKNDNWLIVSKFPKDAMENGIAYYLHQSLRKLNQKKLYGYLAHSTESIICKPALWTELIELKQKGLIEKIGVSLYYPKELDSLLSLGLVPEIVQVPFNILDHRFISSFKHLKKMGTEIHTRSTFLQGLFFIKAEKLSSHFDSIRHIVEFLQKKYHSNERISSTLLSHCLAIKEIDKVVIGVNNGDQLKGTLKIIKAAQNISSVIDEFDLAGIAEIEKIILPVNWPKNI